MNISLETGSPGCGNGGGDGAGEGSDAGEESEYDISGQSLSSNFVPLPTNKLMKLTFFFHSYYFF